MYVCMPVLCFNVEVQIVEQHTVNLLPMLTPPGSPLRMRVLPLGARFRFINDVDNYIFMMSTMQCWDNLNLGEKRSPARLQYIYIHILM
jgi:hypothetical protein